LFGGYQQTGNDYVKKAFHQANQHCNSVWSGGTLAVFHNPYYQFFGTSIMEEAGRNVWIGGLTTSNQG